MSSLCRRGRSSKRQAFPQPAEANVYTQNKKSTENRAKDRQFSAFPNTMYTLLGLANIIAPDIWTDPSPEMTESESQEKTQSQSERALAGIRELLFSGVFPPGARLSEPAIAERLGLSRTPVRAALARLEQEGTVDAIRSGGFAVRKFATDDILDAIELRGVLEGTAARLGAERGISPPQSRDFSRVLSEIDLLLQATGKDLDHEAYTASNATFHRLVKESCGSAVIAREIDRLTALPFASPNALLMVLRDLPEFHSSLVLAQSQHRAIVEAVELREGSRAEALAREHARLARRNLEVAMNDDRIMARYPALTLVTA